MKELTSSYFAKNEHKKNQEIMGYFIKRYCIIYLLMLLVISCLEIFMIIRGFVLFDFSRSKCIWYMFSYFFLFAFSVMAAVFILLAKQGKIVHVTLFWVIHVYALAIVAWSFLISYLDLLGGGYPIVYLTIIVVLAGTVVIDPIFFTILTVLSSVLLLFLGYLAQNQLFNATGDLVNILVFVIMAVFVSFRNFKVSISEANTRMYLNELSHTDILTGLGNETSYFAATDAMDKALKREDVPFAIVVMDVNGLKYTDDLYGHHYGCHLIVETGHILPTIFKSSRLFHVGGDEFVAIVQKNDLNHLEECMAEFKKKLEYTPIEFDGKQLFLSVAAGYAIHEIGKQYEDTFQLADAAMYANKQAVKAKYGIASR